MNSKKKIQDIIPPKTRTIRQVSIPIRKKKTVEKIEDETALEKKGLTELRKIEESEIEKNEQEEVSHSRIPNNEQNLHERYSEESLSYEEMNNDENKPKHFGIWILAVATIAIVIFIVFKTFTASATITVVPHSKNITLNGATFIASKDLHSEKIKYEIAEVKKEIKREIPATVVANVERKASGTIVIYNETAAPQTLIKSTRFESPGKLIYRIQNSITVPASKKGADGKPVAGKIEALVIADAPGAQYNIGLSDFTIPGFKGDPKYTTIYARSKTLMSGGASTSEKTASEADVLKLRTALKAELSNELFKELSLQKPENYILFSTATAIAFEDVAPVAASPSSVIVTQRAVISGIMFDKKVLAQGIARKEDPLIAEQDIYIDNPNELIFTIQSSTSTATIDPLSGKDVSFKLTGSARIVWNYDGLKFINAVLGKEQDEIQTVLTTQFKSIDKATPQISPFWVRTFPEDSSKIKLTAEN